MITETAMVRIDKDTNQALAEIAQRLGVSRGQVVRYLTNDALPRVRQPSQDDALGRLVLLNQPYQAQVTETSEGGNDGDSGDWPYDK